MTARRELAPASAGAPGKVPGEPPRWLRFASTHLGVAWIMCGLASYAALSLVVRSFLHSDKALQRWQAEVPVLMYDRSMFIFATAFFIDVLSLGFELKTSRLDMVLLPAFVKGMATLTNTLVRYGWAAVGAGPAGNIVMVQRYVCWMHTTPTILLLVKMISTSITRQQVLRAILCVEVMLVTGAAAALCSGWWTVVLGVASHAAFLPLIPYLHQGLTEAGCVVSAHAPRPTMTLVYYMTMLMWSTFGAVWDLRMLGLVGPAAEEAVYLCCDFSAKVVFSSGLMLGSFKGMDSRREGVMRQIQETHRQALVQELRRVIEQKDAFMSSVSHELRTPLNGIIGISEGLLSGCCGLLSEGVRRQVYIVRTSGARLLALINDVMDAAALRQHRLVLKQERLELRQVVGDVSDLARSLVDADVALRNDVPEGMVVWADSGRIIQILNNLLGNAAKFTHHGHIRVSAHWHDPQRQWVAVHVADTGIGIPRHKLASIFLPFEQVDGSISRQYGGFGLGLSITQELVKAHGGELRVRSREGKGSDFTFTLPSYTGQSRAAAAAAAEQQLLRRRHSRVGLPAPPGGDGEGAAAAAAVAAAAAAAAAAAQSGELPDVEDFSSELPYDAAQLAALASSKPFTASSGSFAAPRGAAAAAASATPAPAPRDPRPTQFARTGRHQVLSVDDDTINQTVVQSLLCGAGYEVVALPSGARALEYLESSEVLPDLILLDVMMPDMSGPEVCRRLSTRQPPLHIPVVMISAHTEEAAVVQGLDSGADDYITKPFKRAEFLARIRAKLQLASGTAEQVHGPAAAGDAAASALVMCVDDDEVNHIVVEGMLASQGYRYLKACSGAEALQQLEERAGGPDAPQLVLLDASLPDATGLEVLQRLRDRFSQAALPVVMLTARHNERAIVAALDAGANDYAVKPFRRSELLARIRMHLRASQRAATAAAAGPPLSPVAAALAAAEEELSVELQQLRPAAEQLACVPLLAVELEGLDRAAAGLGAGALSQLLGSVADAFDAAVDKYAVLKVEASDDRLVVAAPISSNSGGNSARTSLQLTMQQPQPQATEGSGDHSRHEQQEQAPGTPVSAHAAAPAAAAAAATTAAQSAPAAAALERLLQLAQELMVAFGLAAPDTCAASGQLLLPAPGPALGHCEAALPAGVVQLRAALHVGSLHAGVVGARRPRYRLLGPALQVVRRAAAAAPLNCVVATSGAATQLLAAGGEALQPLSAPGCVEGPVVADAPGSGHGEGQTLWLVCSAEDVAAASVSGGVGAQIVTASPAGGVPQHQQQRQQQPPPQQQEVPSMLSTSLPKQGASLPPLLGSGLQHSSLAALQQQQQQQQLLAAALALQPQPAGSGSLPLLGAPPCWPLGQATGSGPLRGPLGHASRQHNQQPPNGSTAGWAGTGPLAGSGSAAAPDLAALMGALAGWQMGPAEMQELALIQQELDHMQQQLASMACGAPPAASGGTPPRAANGKLAAPLELLRPSASMQGRVGSYAPVIDAPSGQEQPPPPQQGAGAAPAPAAQQGSLEPDGASARMQNKRPAGGGRNGSQLGQLFRRRSRKQRASDQ